MFPFHHGNEQNNHAILHGAGYSRVIVVIIFILDPETLRVPKIIQSI